MSEDKKKSSGLPPYDETDIHNAAIAKSGSSVPKGLILTKEKRDMTHAACYIEEAAHYVFKKICDPIWEDEEKHKEKKDSSSVKIKEKPKK